MVVVPGPFAAKDVVRVELLLGQIVEVNWRHRPVANAGVLAGHGEMLTDIDVCLCDVNIRRGREVPIPTNSFCLLIGLRGAPVMLRG